MRPRLTFTQTKYRLVKVGFFVHFCIAQTKFKIMVDIVIPLGNGCIWDDNNELKYALRSVQKHLKGFGDVIIVGQKPKWIKNIIHIPCDDKRGHEWRDYNIFSKIITAIEGVDTLSENFFFISTYWSEYRHTVHD